MRFGQSLLDEIRTRVPISEIVGRRVKLKRAGRGYSGLCPFHQEKTPSFNCDDGRQSYKCFGCGAGGDIFRFVMETEGLGFPEAVERMASLAGVALPKAEPQDEEREKQRACLHDVLEEASRFFEYALTDRRGEAARAYLERRGLAAPTLKEFRIGYAPNSRNALREHLSGKKISTEMMVEAGLLVVGDDIPVPYDRFRDRVIFPIQDSRGRIVAFGGRALSKDAQAKYLNSPETPLFHKGRMLFNAHRARLPARDRNRVIAVEGYMDAIACAAAGLTETVAPLGTALTEDQLAQLWRLAPEPILCFDGDKAGLNAMNRAIDAALPLLSAGKSLRFALLPEGKDPDDLIRAGGAAAMTAVLDKAEPLIDRLWLRERESAAIDTPERRAALQARIDDLVRTIRHETVRRHYSDLLRRRLSALFAPPKREFVPRRAGVRPNPGGPQVKAHEMEGLISQSLKSGGHLSSAPFFRREALILGALINYPPLIDEHVEMIAALDFESGELDELKVRLLEVAFEGASDSPALKTRLGEAGFGPLLDRLQSLWRAKPNASLEEVETGWRRAALLQKTSRTLHSELKEAQAALARDVSEANWAWIKRVSEELARVEAEAALAEGFGAAD